MTDKVKRSEFATYIDCAPDAETYSLIGVGVTAAEIAYNPNIVSETYIHENNASAEVEGYSPTMPLEAVCVNGDAVFEFIDGLRKERAILDDAHTSIVNVWLYETPAGTSYEAEQQDVTISIDSYGGDGGAATRINYTISYRGDPLIGDFDTSDNSFTADA